MNLKISGIGYYLPEYIETSEELAPKINKSIDWINTRTGVVERRVSDIDVDLMGAKASKLALKDEVPDLILKTLEGKPKIEILGSGNQIRHYTYGEDLAKGICLLLEHENAKNEDFNLSTSQSTTVLELAEIIWNKVRPEEKFQYQSVDSFEFDVQKRIPSTEKAKKLLGYEATTTIEDMLDVVIPWIINAKERSLF